MTGEKKCIALTIFACLLLCKVVAATDVAPGSDVSMSSWNYTYWFPYVDNVPGPSVNSFHSKIYLPSGETGNAFLDLDYDGSLDAGEPTLAVEPLAAGLTFWGAPYLESLPEGCALKVVADVPMSPFYMYMSADYSTYDETNYMYSACPLGTSFHSPLGGGQIVVAATENNCTVTLPSGTITLNLGDTYSYVPQAADAIMADKPIAAVYVRNEKASQDQSMATSLTPTAQAGTEFAIPARPIFLYRNVQYEDVFLALLASDGLVTKVDAPSNSSVLSTPNPVVAYYVIDVYARDPWTSSFRHYTSMMALPSAGQLGRECTVGGSLVSTRDNNLIAVDSNYDDIPDNTATLSRGEEYNSPIRAIGSHPNLRSYALGAVQAGFPVYSYVLEVGNWAGIDEMMSATNILLNLTSAPELDTDGDGLSDEFEISIGTDPNNSDTDGDGLSDGEEVGYDGDPTSYTPYPPGGDLDPTNPDTDGDGAGDGHEVAARTDPLDPTDVPPPGLLEVLLEEDFDSYPPGTYLGDLPGWTSWYNANNRPSEWYVSDQVQVSAPCSARMYGTLGSCWEGYLSYAIPTRSRVRVSAAIYSAGAASGCHGRDVTVYLSDLRSGTWGTSIAGIAVRTDESTVGSGIIGSVYGGGYLTLVPDYSAVSGQWYEIEFVLDYSSGYVEFWVDGQGRGSLPIPANIPDFKDLSLQSGDGVGWVDDIRVVAEGVQEDRDGDGLTDEEENSIGTDPNNPDTDGDGLTDGFEVCYDGDCYSYDPWPGGLDLNALLADTDGDGVSDKEEIDSGTDPLGAHFSGYTLIKTCPTPGRSWDVGMLDCTGDGGQEIIVKYESNPPSDSSTVECRDLTGQVLWCTEGAGAVGAFEIYDIDGDGQEEVVCANGTVVELDGSKWGLPISSLGRYIHIADINQDTLPEILIAEWDANLLYVYSHLGSEIWRYQDNGDTRGVWSCDIDGDGQQEVFSGSWDLYGFTAAGSKIHTYSFSGWTTDNWVGDVDGDEVVDVVTTTYPDTLYCFDAHTEAVKWSTQFPAEPHAPLVSDLNGDGTREVVVCAGSTVYILQNSGIELWSQDIQGEALLGFPNAIYADDLNSDGWKEIVVGGNLGVYLFSTSAPVPPVDSDGDGLSDEFEISIGTLPDNEDTDGDGLLDGFEVCYDGDCSSYDPWPPGGDLNANNLDTDGDGVDDWTEDEAGTDPLDVTDFPGCVESHIEMWDGSDFVPGSLSLTGTSSLYVIVHGWYPVSLDPSWMREMAEALEEADPYGEVLRWNWLEHATSPIPPTRYVVGEAYRLASALYFPDDGDIEEKTLVHFLGHSLGAGVSTHAAKVLRDRGVMVRTRLTLLDPPEDVMESPIWRWIGSGPLNQEELIEALSVTENTDIETYISEVGPKNGYPSSMNVWLKSAADVAGCRQCGSFGDHSLAHAWYGSTISPPPYYEWPTTEEGELLCDYFHYVATPQEFWSGVGSAGYRMSWCCWSLLYPKPYGESSGFYPFELQPFEGQQPLINPTYDTAYTEDFSSIGTWEPRGNAYLSEGEMHLLTQSPTVVYKTLVMPETATVLRFEFRFEESHEGDTLVLYANDSVLCMLPATTLAEGTMQDSGWIDISQLAGQTVQLCFVLLPGTAEQAHAVIDNLVIAEEVWPDTDSDGDGLLDVDEGIGDPDGDAIPNSLDLDSDGDALADNEETAFGADPYDADTDDDGAPDGYEVATGTDPSNEADTPPDVAALTYDGDTLVSTEGESTAAATLAASLRDEFGGEISTEGLEMTFTLRAEGIGTIQTSAFTVGGVATANSVLEPAIYAIEITVSGLPVAANAFLVVYNPEGGFATGGGWILPLDDGINTYPWMRANFGFNAKYKSGLPTGHMEFRYQDGYVDLKSSSIEQLVITGGRIAQFKGRATVNKTEGHWFFAKAIDNDEPGTGNDTFEIKIWGPGVDPDGDPTERASGVLEGGNIVVHAR